MLRRTIAVAFLVFLLTEWGSHSLAFAHASSNEGSILHVQHGAHEDLCKTLIRCPEGPRQEVPAAKTGHDVVQQRSIFCGSYAARPQFDPDQHLRSARSRISGLFRALAPPFHPPKFS